MDNTTTGSALATLTRGTDGWTDAAGTNSDWTVGEMANYDNAAKVSKKAGGEAYADAQANGLIIGWKVKYAYQDDTVLTIKFPFKE